MNDEKEIINLLKQIQEHLKELDNKIDWIYNGLNEIEMIIEGRGTTSNSKVDIDMKTLLPKCKKR